MWDRVRTRLLSETTGQRHRASSDAEFIQRVFAHTQALCLKTRSRMQAG